MKRKITCLLILAVFISLFSVTGCYKDDEARVTIHIERNDLIGQKPVQKKWFIDRVLEFFSTPVEAAAWDSTHTGLLTLTIVHPNTGTQVVELPAGTTEYEIILPSANSVTFTIIHKTSYNNWGGEIVKDLTAGDVNVNIQMIPMAVIESIPMAYTSSRSIVFSAFGAPPPSYTSGVKLYRATTADGEYVLTNTTAFLLTGLNNSLTEGGTIPAGTYYYKIRIYGPSGDGLLSVYYQQNVTP